MKEEETDEEAAERRRRDEGVEVSRCQEENKHKSSL